MAEIRTFNVPFRVKTADISCENVGTRVLCNGVCSKSCQTGEHATGRRLLGRQWLFGLGPQQSGSRVSARPRSALKEAGEEEEQRKICRRLVESRGGKKHNC